MYRRRHSILIMSLFIRYYLHHFNICWQPLHAVQFVFREPSCRLMFIQVQRLCLQGAEVAMHLQVKGRIIILHRTKEFIHADVCRKFLANLPYQRFFRCFPSLHFPARELPPVLPLTISPLSGENLIFLANNRSYDFYLFHNSLNPIVHNFWTASDKNLFPCHFSSMWI